MAVFAALVAIGTGAGAAYQTTPGIAIRIAGPSVTYVADGCPSATEGGDLAPHTLTFVTTDPNGSGLSSPGVRTADRQFSLTTDIRADDPDGQYSVAATCVSPDGTVAQDYAAALFWVNAGIPSMSPTENGPDSGDSAGGGTDPNSDENPANNEGSTTGDGAGSVDDGSGDQTQDDTASNEQDETGPEPTPTPSTDADDVPPANPTGSTDGSTEDATDPSVPAAGQDNGTAPAGSTPNPSPTAAASPQPSPASKATSVQVTPAQASSGDTVTTWIQGCPATVDGATSAVAFAISSPSGSQKMALSTEPGSNGAFSIAIRVPQSPELGTYTISASCGLQDGDTFVERRAYAAASFEVIAGVGLEIPKATPSSASSPGRPVGATNESAAPTVPVQRPEIGFTG